MFKRSDFSVTALSPTLCQALKLVGKYHQTGNTMKLLEKKQRNLQMSVTRWKSGLVLKMHEFVFGWKMAWLAGIKHCLCFTSHTLCLPLSLLRALMRNQTWPLDALVMTLRTRDGRCPFLSGVCLAVCLCEQWAKGQGQWCWMINWMRLCVCGGVCLICFNCLSDWYEGCGVNVWEEVDRGFRSARLSDLAPFCVSVALSCPH